MNYYINHCLNFLFFVYLKNIYADFCIIISSANNYIKVTIDKSCIDALCNLTNNNL